ncbi:MAG: 3-hydroxyacyl-CoA dehydrogenase NAD-binding domain-containing protein [Candidatus Geothermincolales bacterium]
MEIKRVMVAGAGVMGSGIAQLFSSAGYEVILLDRDMELAERGLELVRRGFEKAVNKGAISEEEAKEALERITLRVDWEAASEADFILESVSERKEVKEEVLSRLGYEARPEVVMATNTSSIPITPLGDCTGRPDRFVGMHFFNPAPVMPLVEVIRGSHTSDETVETVLQLARNLGKTPVEAKDWPGFIVSRVYVSMINEAIWCLHDGVASARAIDQAVTLGTGHPLGPLATADLMGLDVLLNILDILYDHYRDPKYRACPLLRQMVYSGKLGRKSGEGFYRYVV